MPVVVEVIIYTHVKLIYIYICVLFSRVLPSCQRTDCC